MKNPIKVALGRKGGQVSGQRRAARSLVKWSVLYPSVPAEAVRDIYDLGRRCERARLRRKLQALADARRERLAERRAS